jgi:hypothetical protein
MSYALGLCTGHYHQFHRKGKITHITIGPHNTPPRPCSTPGCGKRAIYVTKGLCKNCYERGQRRVRAAKQRKLCSVDGCGNVSKTLGLCNTHYIRQYRHGSVDVVKDWGAGRRTLRQQAN